MSRAFLLVVFAKCLVLSAMACLLLPAGPVGAQTKGGGAEDAKVMLPREGADNLDKKFRTREVRDQVAGLAKGSTQPTEANREVIESAAKWHIYRVTWNWLQNEPERMDFIYKDFSNLLTDIQKGRPGNDRFLQMFTKQCLDCIKEVLQNDRAIARINGARMLSRLAGAGQEEVCDLLVEVLKDPKQNDAVKFWVLRGFQEFFKLTRGENFIRIRDEEREKRCILALLEYLNRNPGGSDSTPSEEVEALQYVRREAVKALGETRHPAVVGKDKKLVPEGLTALSLLKVLRKDGLTPPPTLAEQVEAAIALCQLYPEPFPDYQPDYAVSQIGRFLIDFTQQCLDERELKQEPWKVNVVRMSQALEEMKNYSKRTPQSDYINKAAAQARPLLESLERAGPSRPADLDAWLNQNPPKGTTTYKSMENSVVKPPVKE